jgi:GNAT superfamily N-acetyltransferase
MSIRIETPRGTDALTEFILFHDRVYAHRRVAWTAFVPLQLPLLTGESPLARGRTIRPFVAREHGEIVARAVAVIDEHYHRHWNERLGHIDWFEALPDAREATERLMDAACDWLREQGTQAARAGFGLLELPFVIDDYASLPPLGMRQNPAFYHTLLKEARFVVEKGWVDYKIRVSAEWVARWESALADGRRAGFEIVPLREIPERRRMAEFIGTWNDAFRAHWGAIPATEDGFAVLFRFLEPAGFLDTSFIAYWQGEPVGALQVTPEISATAVVRPGEQLQDAEKLNFLGIGVRRSARGRGVNLAMAASAYLQLVRRGAKYLSYTLVLDDNWPSRRTAEKLGAHVCANYVVYRRDFS